MTCSAYYCIEQYIQSLLFFSSDFSFKLQGFIRNECFDPKTWIIPGDNSQTYTLRKEVLSNERIVYDRETSKTVADVIEALIGVFICTTSERAALAFMKWMGFEVDFVYVQYKRPVAANPEKLVDLRFFKSLLNQYSFRDASLLVEALTHGSYVRPESPTSYEVIFSLPFSHVVMKVTRSNCF